MMHKFASLLLRTAPALLCLTPLVLDAAPATLTVERLFSAPDLSGASLRSPRFSPDGKLVTYLQGKSEAKDRLDIWAFDPASGRNALLVDSAALAADEGVLSPEEEARRERARTSSLAGIIDYEFSADSRYLLIPLAGDLFLYDLRAAAPNQTVRRLTQTADAETDPRFSPRGNYVAFVRAQNLYVIDLATGREHAVTREGGGLVSYGMAEFIAQEEMDRQTGYWWAPDDSAIVYARVDESTVDEVERFEIYASSVKVVRQRYPAAGRPNARVNVFVAVLKSGDQGKEPKFESRALPAADPGEGYLARVHWLPNAKAIAVQRQSRDQRQLELMQIDLATGASRRLLEERSDTWIDLHDELTFLRQRGGFIWASMRSGYRHLYLHAADGTLLRPLTAGEWMVAGDAGERAIEAVDEARGLVYFTANRETPLERHLYSAPLAGAREPRAVEAEIRKLSEGSGWHSSSLSRDGRLWLDTFSTPNSPPSLTLRDRNGRQLAVLVANTLDAQHPYAAYLEAHQPTEYGTLQAADGQTLHYQLIKPMNMQPGKRYPVIVDLYGGPGNQRVRRAWPGFPRSNEGFFRQLLAQRGYVVFTLDNRGTSFRGVKFESAIHRRMGTVEVEDQVRGVEFLRTLPFVDAQRVGVFGWSYGGYLSLMCMVRAPEYFTAGVAGAPVTDWHLYDTHYTERYMGTPADNAAGYADGMVMTHARNLRGDLLIMHGMADDNVLFTHSTALFKTLQDERKPFDVMPYPGSKHALMRFAATGPHGYQTVLRFFDRALRNEPGANITP
ncbi:MAG: DPP IV N-terminal domain-containing protein [Steroidobacteraceae bacterium]